MSKSNELADFSNQQLIDAYLDLSRQQGLATEQDDTREYNRLFDKVAAISRELRRRGDDVRKTMLIPLLKRSPSEATFDFKAAQRRYNAAMDLMAVAPDLAKATLEELANGPILDYCARAGGALMHLEKGIWKPR